MCCSPPCCSSGCWGWPIGRRAHGQLESLTGKFNGGNSANAADSAKLTLKAAIEPPEGNRPAIAGHCRPGRPGLAHLLDLQPPGGPIRSKIKLSHRTITALLGDFTVNLPPAVHEYADIWPGVKVEEHAGKVTWQAPIELAAGVDPAKLEIAGAVYAQICAETCLPPRDYKFVATASAAGTASAGTAPAAGTPSAAPGRTVLASKLGPPATPAPSGSAPDRPGHRHRRARGRQRTVAGRSHRDSRSNRARRRGSGGTGEAGFDRQPDRTLVSLRSGRSRSRRAGQSQADVGRVGAQPGISHSAGRQPAASRQKKMFDGHLIHYHPREVSWTVPITVAADASPGDYPIAGLIGFMTCKDGSCDLPTAARFSGTLRVAAGSQGATALQFVPAKYEQVRRMGAPCMSPKRWPPPATASASRVQEVRSDRSQRRASQFAADDSGLQLFGWFDSERHALCAAGHWAEDLVVRRARRTHARRILMLNLIYAAGMMAVFLVLATLAVTLNLSWGQHFNSIPFTITLAALVFAMALSFLGVWEIPIPGFVGSGAAAEVACARERPARLPRASLRPSWPRLAAGRTSERSSALRLGNRRRSPIWCSPRSGWEWPRLIW